LVAHVRAWAAAGAVEPDVVDALEVWSLNPKNSEPWVPEP